MAQLTDAQTKAIAPFTKRLDLIKVSASQIDVAFFCGTLIDVAAAHSVEIAQALTRTVVFEFNGIECRVLSDSKPAEIVDHYHATLDARHKEWVSSAEGKAYEARRQEEFASQLEKVRALEAQLPAIVDDRDALVAWVGAFGEVNDHVDIKIDRNGILGLLNGAGYQANDCVGDKFDGENKDNFARWLIGQAMDGLLRRGGRVRPIAAKFAKEYAEKFAP